MMFIKERMREKMRRFRLKKELKMRIKERNENMQKMNSDSKKTSNNQFLEIEAGGVLSTEGSPKIPEQFFGSRPESRMEPRNNSNVNIGFEVGDR